MKIAVNARFLIKGKMEGIGWYSHEVIRRMVAEHPEHEFHLIFDRPYDPDFIFGSNVIPHVLFPPARHPFLWWIWFEWSLPYLIRRIDPDVFFSPDGYLSLSLEIPQVMVMHDLAFLHFPGQIPFLVRKYYRHFVPRFLRKAAHVCAVSTATLLDIAANYFLPENKMSVAYNGCKEEFRPLDESQIREVRLRYSGGSPYFLFVGAMHPRKNIPNLIRGFGVFKKQSGASVKLLLVGRQAWLTREIQVAFDESAYQLDIVFLPYLQPGELALLTGAALAAVAPSHLEGFGVPVLEALQCDVPVLVSDRFSLPEVGGPGALRFDPSDPDAIGQAMSEIMDERKRQECIDLGRAHRTHFSWDASARHIFAQLESVVKTT